MKIEDARMGDLVQAYSDGYYGFIVGISQNISKEPLLVVQWAYGKTLEIHPANLRRITPSC
jgi:hypothetical protein